MGEIDDLDYDPEYENEYDPDARAEQEKRRRGAAEATYKDAARIVHGVGVTFAGYPDGQVRFSISAQYQPAKRGKKNKS